MGVSNADIHIQHLVVRAFSSAGVGYENIHIKHLVTGGGGCHLHCIYHHHCVPSVVNRSAVIDLHRSRSCATLMQSLYVFVHSLMYIVLSLPRPLLYTCSLLKGCGRVSGRGRHAPWWRHTFLWNYTCGTGFVVLHTVLSQRAGVSLPVRMCVIPYGWNVCNSLADHALVNVTVHLWQTNRWQPCFVRTSLHCWNSACRSTALEADKAENRQASAAM